MAVAASAAIIAASVAANNAAIAARHAREKAECTAHYQETETCHARCLRSELTNEKRLTFWKSENTYTVSNECAPQTPWTETSIGMSSTGIFTLIVIAVVIVAAVVIAASRDI